MPRDFRPGGDPQGGVYAGIDPYPAARQNRGRGIPTNNALPLVAQLPNVRLWNWYIESTAANAITQVASPRFVGPLFVDQFYFNFLTVGRTNPMPLFFIYYQSTPYVNLQNAAGVTRRTGTPLFDYTPSLSAGAQAQPNQGSLVIAPSGASQAIWKLGKYIADPEVFFVVGHTSPVAGAMSTTGSLRILENVDALTVAGLIAS
jgi:hypothetical protein